MLELLTVCTANICRSPIAEGLLRTRLAPIPAVVRSAGTRGLTDHEMAPEAAHLATRLGVPADQSAAHRARLLTEAHLTAPDLVLAMTREHRRVIVELAPARLRSTFTIREFARLSAGLSDEEIAAAAADGGTDASARVRAMAAAVASRRGVVAPAADPADDDVVDPYRRPWEVYQLSASQMLPGLNEVVRAVRVAVSA